MSGFEHSVTGPAGWTCHCGAWVPNGATHSCARPLTLTWGNPPAPPDQLAAAAHRLAAAIDRLAAALELEQELKT